MPSHITTQEAVETWKFAHGFVLDIYKLTARLPHSENASLIPKLRNSSVKIASNIVEGYARKSAESYLGHLSESQTALEETKYSILVARDLGYISEHAYGKAMRSAETLSERLESLHERLGDEHAAAGQLDGSRAGASGRVASRHGFGSSHAEEAAGLPGSSDEAPLFGVHTGVGDSWSEFTGWVRGLRGRLSGRRKEGHGGGMFGGSGSGSLPEPSVWVEELDAPRTGSYLDDR